MLPEDSGVPFIESPDMMNKPEGTGLYCFMDSARTCDADCMAFLLVSPEGADYEDKQWSRCMLLVNAHKLGKHAVALAGQGDSLVKHLRVRAADAARASQTPPGNTR